MIGLGPKNLVSLSATRWVEMSYGLPVRHKARFRLQRFRSGSDCMHACVHLCACVCVCVCVRAHVWVCACVRVWVCVFFVCFVESVQRFAEVSLWVFVGEPHSVTQARTYQTPQFYSILLNPVPYDS